MAKPTRHRDKWRIRWTDHTGKRRSEVYERYNDAEVALLRHQLEVAEVKRGHRAPIEEGWTHTELFDYEKDPEERRSWHEDPSCAVTLSELDALLREGWRGICKASTP